METAAIIQVCEQKEIRRKKDDTRLKIKISMLASINRSFFLLFKSVTDSTETELRLQKGSSWQAVVSIVVLVMCSKEM